MGKKIKANEHFYTSTALGGTEDGLFIQEKCCSACGDTHGEQQGFEEEKDYHVKMPVIDPSTGDKKQVDANVKGAIYVLCPKTQSKVYLIWG